MGIVGYGSIGQECGRIARAFKMNIIALRRRADLSTEEKEQGLKARLLPAACCGLKALWMSDIATSCGPHMLLSPQCAVAFTTAVRWPSVLCSSWCAATPSRCGAACAVATCGRPSLSAVMLSRCSADNAFMLLHYSTVTSISACPTSNCCLRAIVDTLCLCTAAMSLNSSCFFSHCCLPAGDCTSCSYTAVLSIKERLLPLILAVNLQVYTPDKLNQLMADSDYVVAALPYTDKTDKFINAEAIGSMRSRGVFVNVGRGKTVDEQALIQGQHCSWLPVPE